MGSLGAHGPSAAAVVFNADFKALSLAVAGPVLVPGFVFAFLAFAVAVAVAVAVEGEHMCRYVLSMLSET